MTDTEIATIQPKPMEYINGTAVPRDVNEAYSVAQQLANSGMVPKTYQGKPDSVIVAIQMGAELGLTPMASLSSIAVINGTPAIWGDGLLALVLDSGLLEDIDEEVKGEGDSLVATCTVYRKGMKKEKVRSFSVADAKAANLWTKAGPWKQYPKRMLQMRARAFALRDVFPDVLKGLKIREEVEDYSNPKQESRQNADDAKAVFQAKEIEAEVSDK